MKKFIRYDLVILLMAIISNGVFIQLFIITPRIEQIYAFLILGIFNAVWLSNWLKIKLYQWSI